MARRATVAIDAPADYAWIEPGLAMWGALVEVPPAHEVVGWRPGDLGWVARRDAPSSMARRATGVIDAPADSTRIGHGPARWVALAEVPRAHEVTG